MADGSKPAPHYTKSYNIPWNLSADQKLSCQLNIIKIDQFSISA